MPLRRIEHKEASFKTLLHLDALKTSKTRKIVFVSKNSIILSSETEIFSLSTLSDVEDLSLLRLNLFKTFQLNLFKISQIFQAVNVNALILSELVIFVTKTAATLVT